MCTAPCKYEELLKIMYRCLELYFRKSAFATQFAAPYILSTEYSQEEISQKEKKK